MPKRKTLLGWHFCESGRMYYPHDLRKVKVGVWMKAKRPSHRSHYPRPEPCCWGMHASKRVHHAALWRSGNLCRVEVKGFIKHHENNKFVGLYRKVLWMIPGPAVEAEIRRVLTEAGYHDYYWDKPTSRLTRFHGEYRDAKVRASVTRKLERRLIALGEAQLAASRKRRRKPAARRAAKRS